jgi:hypothetical protein
MKIFAEMHRAQRECPERPPVFSALGSFEWDFARDKPYAERLVDPQRRTHLHFNKDTPHVLGCLAAWSPQWLEAQGGFPTCVMEDYALGILAELKGGGRRRSEAQVWAYGPTSRADHWRTIRRYVQGTFQLLSMFHAEFHAAPELRKKVLSEQDWLVSPKALAKNNFEEFSRSPSAQGAVRAVYRTARALLTVAQGWWDNLRSPHQQTWQATRSTKL